MPGGLHREYSWPAAQLASDELLDGRHRAAARAGGRPDWLAGRRAARRLRAHGYSYAQRTADNRIALGGRGVPYRYGSRTDADGATQPQTIVQLARILQDMFPAARGAAIDHAWAGVLGVPRDWTATVGLDPRTGLGWAGGYVGTGVAATNLAARTLRDLILDPDSELAAMPWTNRRVRRWEPEPLR